jgi:hypothetical protein
MAGTGASPGNPRRTNAVRDIATLKERVDHAERHLKATETARNRESEALMETWRKIRERFTHQENEIARYRGEVEALTEANEALGKMVDELIGIIDGNIERGRDETVPKIAALAGDLLASEPSADDLAKFAGDAGAASAVAGFDQDAGGPADDGDGYEIIELDEPADPDDLLALDAELDHDESDLDIPDVLVEAAADGDDQDRDASAESLSPGIRNLIERVEGAVRDRRLPTGATAGFEDFPGGVDDVEDEELARELQEIETLRNELSGLRDRIAAAEG